MTTNYKRKEVGSIRQVPVCVVGGAGFLGSHLVRHLTEDRGCKVLVVDNFVSGKYRFVPEGVGIFNMDITHSMAIKAMRKEFVSQNIGWVFNYAACPYIPTCYQRPDMVIQTNFNGAWHVLQACEGTPVQGMLQVSSAEVYGTSISGSIDESHHASPRSTYGVAKLAIDQLIQCRHREAGTKALSLRQFNCVGERETHPYVIPEIIRQLKSFEQLRNDKDLPPIKLGNNTWRDFMYAGDAVRMAVELLEKGRYGECYNLGSESSVKIYELAKTLYEIWRMGHSERLPNDIHIEHDPERVRKWEIWSLNSDNRRIHGVIDQRPTVDLNEALVRTMRDYHENGWCWEDTIV